MKIYISGQVTGIPYDAAYTLFAKAEFDIKETGHEPVNPLKKISKHSRWVPAMKESIAMMMECTGIFLMENWKESEGARLEFYLAATLQFDIFYEKDLHNLRLLKEHA